MLVSLRRSGLILGVVVVVLCLGSQGIANATTAHSCALGKTRSSGVKSLKANTSCKTARYLASFTSLPRGKFHYAGRTWKGQVSHANGTFQYDYRTTGNGPLLAVWVFY